MDIQRNRVVSFHYVLRDAAEGTQLETSRDGEPSLYLHGARNLLPALERALSGKCVGDTFDVPLSAAEAYGARDPAKQQRVPIKHLFYEGKLRPGTVVRVNSEKGRLPATVLKAGKFSADLDMNHPLAGRNVVFEVEILSVREASAEEIAHGHAHGPGGHHH